jgi:2'-5' RNA ligase
MPRVCYNLTFDDATEHAIRMIWQRLAAAGLVVRGLTGYRPHITLAVYEDSELVTCETALRALAAATSVFPVRFETLGIFPEAGVLFLEPRMSHTLFMFHRQVLHTCDALGSPTMIDDLLLPDRWAPHCTLVGRLTTSELLTAIERCQSAWTPIRGQAIGIGMRLYPATEDHQFYAFHQPDDAELGHSSPVA